MKKLITFAILLLMVGVTLNYKEDILKLYYQHVYFPSKEVSLGEKNEYYRNYDFLFVQNTDKFNPHNKQELLNIFYTVINAGKEKFSFYCPDEYEKCSEDVTSIAQDQIVLSTINNYVHPFNSFKDISTQTDNVGKVTISITKSYTDEDIDTIKGVITKIKNEKFNSNLSIEDQLKIIHDYIIDNSIYDSNRTDNNVIEYKSDIAYGTLVEGYGICGGYADAFELFLEELNIKSFKVASDTHIWNAVYLYNSWYHYDLTWDDPVTNTHEQIVDDNFLRLTTKELLTKETEQHNFDLNYYKELA